MKSAVAGLAAAGLLLGPSAALALGIAITFDSLSDQTVITNQYPGVVFSSTPGNVNYVTTWPASNSTPQNVLCSGPAGSGFNCVEEMIVTFAAGIHGLRFDAVGIDSNGLIARVDVFVGGAFGFTQDVIGNAEGFDPLLINLSAVRNLTGIRIYDIADAGGVGWDTFLFFPRGAPEPGTLVLLGLGLAGLGVSRRHLAESATSFTIAVGVRHSALQIAQGPPLAAQSEKGTPVRTCLPGHAVSQVALADRFVDRYCGIY